MKAFGFLFARGGSKGIPGKNIRPMCGRPLLSYALATGRACGRLERMFVSTDSVEIAETARKYGAEVPFMRPAELATDKAVELHAWRHAVEFLQARGDNFDVFVSLPATAPLRTADDVRHCLDLYAEGDCDMVIACSETGRSPYFTMIALDERNYARLALTPDRPYTRRQDAPKMYEITSAVYVTSPAFVLSGKPFWEARIKAVVLPRINAMDIDDETDWEIAEFFMAKRLAEKSLD